MLVIINDDPMPNEPLPCRPFVARHRSTNGPLCIVVENVGHGKDRFGVLFLDGGGCAAAWDQWSGMTAQQVHDEFFPVKHSITLKNRWPGV